MHAANSDKGPWRISWWIAHLLFKFKHTNAHVMSLLWARSPKWFMISLQATVRFPDCFPIIDTCRSHFLYYFKSAHYHYLWRFTSDYPAASENFAPEISFSSHHKKVNMIFSFDTHVGARSYDPCPCRNLVVIAFRSAIITIVVRSCHWQIVPNCLIFVFFIYYFEARLKKNCSYLISKSLRSITIVGKPGVC